MPWMNPPPLNRVGQGIQTIAGRAYYVAVDEGRASVVDEDKGAVDHHASSDVGGQRCEQTEKAE